MNKRLACLMTVVACLELGVLEARSQVATRVAAGDYHNCAVTTSGGVVCWGYNDYGTLGDGTAVMRTTPTAVVGLTGEAASVAAGIWHTCALTTAGGVACWGGNWYGQLGDGTTTQRLTPVPVSGLQSGVTAIAAGQQHMCALIAGGGVVCWGHNENGQLGDATTTNRTTPTPVTGLESGVAAIAAGYSHTCAVTTGGAVLCWGLNHYGQLGDTTTTPRLTPTPVHGLGSGMAAVAAGDYHTCAMTIGGGVVCWGDNSWGALGDGTTNQHLTPTPVFGLGSGTAGLEAGGFHTCALSFSGALACWGRNGNGQLGTGTTDDCLTPAAVSGPWSRVAGVAAGYLHSCALTTAGAVLCWGSNWNGAIGDGTTTDHPAPTQVTGLEGRPPSAASDFTGDLKSDLLWHHAARGEVWLWPMSGGEHTAKAHVKTVGEPGWEIRGLGDQTGDGQADILWRHATTGQLYLWTMDGAAVEAEAYVGMVNTAFDIEATGDYNADGRSDILWRHQANGQLWVWLMNGPATLSVLYIDTVDLGYHVKGSGDLNADGMDDLVWQGAAGDVWLWLMTGPTSMLVTSVTTVSDLGYRIVGVADYTGDERADLLWHHATRGELWVWAMTGATQTGVVYVDTVADTGYRIVGHGDYDGDGQADILWHHATRGEVWVWLMDGAVKRSEPYVGMVPDTGYRIVR